MQPLQDVLSPNLGETAVVSGYSVVRLLVRDSPAQHLDEIVVVRDHDQLEMVAFGVAMRPKLKKLSNFDVSLKLTVL
jgi:hypothetical protein